MKTQALKGMRDLLPAEQALRDYIRIIQEEYQNYIMRDLKDLFMQQKQLAIYVQ